MSIFLSYSRRDSELVCRLCGDLEASGLQVWMDRNDIEAGTHWRTSIVNGIESCKVFLLVVSAASQQSSNVAKEMSLAESNDKPILPVKIDDSPIQSDFSYSLAGIQFIDMPLKGYENSLLEVVRFAQQLLLVDSLSGAHPTERVSAKEATRQDDQLAAPPAPARPPFSNSHVDCAPPNSPAVNDKVLLSIEQAMGEELGPIVQLLWSRDFGLDLLEQPNLIVSKLQALGVPEDAAIRLRQRLQPFLPNS